MELLGLTKAPQLVEAVDEVLEQRVAVPADRAQGNAEDCQSVTPRHGVPHAAVLLLVVHHVDLVVHEDSEGRRVRVKQREGLEREGGQR